MEPLNYAHLANSPHWRAVLALVNTADPAGRKIVQGGSVPLSRDLPLSLRYKPADWPGHDGAVNVGSIDKVWFEGNRLMGEGRFDLVDPVAVDVVRKIRMGFVRHVSADMLPGREWKLTAATVLDIPAFEEAQFTAINLPEPELKRDVPVEPHPVREHELVPFAFRVVGDTSLGFASREREWDSGAAVARVFAWAGDDVNRIRRAFLYQDEGADPALKGSYKLPFADVVDGELVAVPRAVFAVAGGRGIDAADIPASDKATIKRRVSALYRKMAKKFDDPGLKAPWDGESSQFMVPVDGMDRPLMVRSDVDAVLRANTAAFQLWRQEQGA